MCEMSWCVMVYVNLLFLDIGSCLRHVVPSMLLIGTLV